MSAHYLCVSTLAPSLKLLAPLARVTELCGDAVRSAENPIPLAAGGSWANCCVGWLLFSCWVRSTTTSVEEVLGWRCLTVISDTLSGGVPGCCLCAEGCCEEAIGCLVTSIDGSSDESSNEYGGTNMGVATCCESGS